MKRIVYIFLAVLAISSCGVMSSKQLEMVSELSFRADSVTSAPAAIFHSLNEVRLERGLYYAASLSTAEARFAEVQGIAKAALEDEKTARKADAYIDVVNSYLRVLRSLSSDERWKAVGRELRGIGRKTDSLIMVYNSLPFEEKLPEGVTRSYGKIAGLIGEQMMKGRRAKVLGDAIVQGDTLVAMCVDSLIEILKGEDLKSLMANEKAGLADNYRAYLMAYEARGETVSVEADRRYVGLYAQMDAVNGVKNRCVSALRSLKKAHHRLVESFDEEEDESIFTDLLEFNEKAAELCQLIKEL